MCIRDRLKTVVGIMPTLVALMIAVGVLRSSGFLDFLEELFLPVSEYLHFPAQLLPLSFIRMFSSSAATGLVLDIFKNYGTDSYIGLVTSIMMSCTAVSYTHLITATPSRSRMWPIMSVLTGAISIHYLRKPWGCRPSSFFLYSV